MIKNCNKLIGLLLLIGSFCTYGQVSIKLSIDKNKYLQYEAVFVNITLTNNSDREIIFTKGIGEVNLEIKNYNNNIIDEIKPVNFAEGLSLQAGTTRSVRVKINKWYNITPINKYQVYAKIKHQLFKGFTLKNITPTSFYVINGITELQQNFGIGVKSKDGENSIKIQTYTVLSYLVENKRYMSLKIEDDKNVYAIRELGNLIRGLPIQHKIDAFSNIHLLFHIGKKTFKYIIFSPQGEEKQRRYLLATKETFPILKLDKDTGSISILNDIHANEGIDYQLNEG